MASIADVISVSVTVQDSVPSEDGFGILACFASVSGAWTGWQTFSNDSDGLASLVLAGAAVGSAAYKMLQAAASQNPKVSKVKIFSRTTHASQTFKLSPTVLTEGYVYSLKISNGSTTATVTHTNGASETAITIATALAAAVTSAAVGTIVGTHSGSDVFFTISVSSGTVRFYLKDVSLGITVEDTSSDGGIATDLAAAVALDNDWFGLAIDTTSATEIAAAATFAEANSKVFLALSEDSAIATSSTTDIASSAKTSGYNFTSVFYETDIGSFPQVGLLARQLSQAPGSSTFHGKRIAASAPDPLTESALTFARGKNALTYVNVKGIPFTFDGKAASGRFLDITIGIEWLRAIIQDAVLVLISNAEKVPYTNLGINQVVSVVSACLQRAQDAGILAGGWTVTAPDVATISATDKGNRLLPDVKFSGTLAGAIHKVEVQGTVSV